MTTSITEATVLELVHVDEETAIIFEFQPGTNIGAMLLGLAIRAGLIDAGTDAEYVEKVIFSPDWLSESDAIVAVKPGPNFSLSEYTELIIALAPYLRQAGTTRDLTVLAVA